MPASPGPLFSDLDLLVTARLNARLDVSAIAALRSFADRAANYLDAAHKKQPDFLLLPSVAIPTLSMIVTSRR